MAKSRYLATAAPWLFGAVLGICGQGTATQAAAQAGNAAPAQVPVNADTKKLLEDAERAQTRGDLGLALIQLKNAVRLAPRNGEARARLGLALLKMGDTRAAQFELRQARMDNAPEELVVPAILDSMIVRGEARQLLEEFPDPLTENKITPDILRARASALQMVGRAAEAKAAIARSLRLRRDTRALITSAKLAMQQGDLALANAMIDEAVKQSPANEDVLTSQIALLYESGDVKKALATADDFIRRVPQSLIARVIRIEARLVLNQDALARDELAALLAQSPDSSFGPYYRGVLLARANDLKGAWHEIQTLNPNFALSQPGIAMMMSEIAIASGNVESGAALLASLVSRRPDFAPGRIRLAAVQLTLKNPEAALKTLDPIKTSDDPQLQAILGQTNLQLGRFNDAIGALEKAIGSSTITDKEPLQLQLAESAFGLGDTGKAVSTLESIRAHGPENWETAISYISSLMQAGKPDEALEVLNRVAKGAGRTPLVPFYRGRVLGTDNDLVGASAAFSEALAIDPKFVPALYFRAHVWVARGNSEAGKKDLRQILALDPANTSAYIALAQIALHEGQETQSVALLVKAISVAPGDGAPRLALAAYQAQQRKFQDARSTLNAALQISPNDPAALTQMGQIQFLAGDANAAVNTFRSLAATYSTSAGTYVLLAKALNATKDRLAAIDAAKQAVELDPFSPKIRSLLIEYLIVGGRPDEALANARDYVAAHPGPDADLVLVSTLIALKRVDEANAYLTSRFAAKPDRLLALRLSQLAMNGGDRKKAVGVLSEWLRNKPDDFDVRRQYGALLLQIGDADGARKEFESLLKQRPEDPVVLNNLSWILRDEDPTRALSMALLASKVVPDSTQVMDSLAWMKFQRRDLQGALLLLRRAHELDAADGEIAYHFAVALDSTGRRAEAKTVLESVVDKPRGFSDRENAKKLLALW